MPRRLLTLILAVTLSVLFVPGAVATGPGGWDHLGHGGSDNHPALNDHVTSLNADNPGILYVGGPFTNAGGKANADYLAQWNGNAWSAVNGSVTLNGAVDAIAYHDGHVYVGGEFTNVGGDTGINFLAEWTGTTWRSPCGANNPITAHVAALQIIGNTLSVGGSFADGGNLPSADFLVACDLTTGVPSSTVANDGDFNSGIYALTADSNGTLYAGGGFINLGGVVGFDHVGYYSGGTWHQMGGKDAVDDIVRSLAAHGTNVYVGTDSINIAGIDKADHIARWDAQTQTFNAMGSDGGTNGWFNSFAFLTGMVTSGSLVFAAGSFQNANGTATADDFAYFDGTSWRAVGSDGAGNGPLNSPVNALAIFQHRVVAGGGFTNAGGDPLGDFIGSHTLLRPDARVGDAAGGPFAGNNVYSSNGIGEHKTFNVHRGHSGTVFLDFQNDGLTPDALKVQGPDGAHGFKLHYYHGSSNVTSQVLAGTWSTDNLAIGAHVTLRVVVAVSTNSDPAGTFLISARTAPGVPTDAIKVIVHAT
jgi:hypothetical protein